MDSYTELNYSHYSIEALRHTQKSPESDRAGRARAGSMPSTHLQSLFVGMGGESMFLLAWLFSSEIQHRSFPGAPAVRMSFSLIMSQTRYTYIYLSLCSVGLFGGFYVVLGFFFHPSSTHSASSSTWTLLPMIKHWPNVNYNNNNKI